MALLPARCLAQRQHHGHVLALSELPAPVWDGLAAVEGRLYVSLKQGEVVCLE